jgi:hypothetical protein
MKTKRMKRTAARPAAQAVNQVEQNPINTYETGRIGLRRVRGCVGTI